MAVPLDPLAADGGHAGGAHVGDLSEVLAAGDVADMDLHGGDAYGLEGVEQGDARVRVGAGVHHDAVVDAIGPLDRVHEVALVVGLVGVDPLEAKLPPRPLHEGQERLVVLRPIDGRLPQAEQVDVWSVDDERLHRVPFVWANG